MKIYKNISNEELPILLRVCFDANDGDIEESARDIDTFDLMLGVLKMSSLINKYNGRKKHSYRQVLEAIIVQRIENKL